MLALLILRSPRTGEDLLGISAHCLYIFTHAIHSNTHANYIFTQTIDGSSSLVVAASFTTAIVLVNGLACSSSRVVRTSSHVHGCIVCTLCKNVDVSTLKNARASE